MRKKAHLWLRDESKPNERRSALSPADVKTLLDAGFFVTVETSSDRIIPNEEYKLTGCEMRPSGSWKNEAPKEAYILGVKELPLGRSPLPQRHIHFAHVFKNQAGWDQTLTRFQEADGLLLDLEYLTDDQSQRVAAFGYWAGFAGAALSLKAWLHQQKKEKTPLPACEAYSSKEELLSEFRRAISDLEKRSSFCLPNALVIGAKGRSGCGAFEFFKELGLKVTGWGLKETTGRGPIAEILQYDLLLNCVFVNEEIPPFLTLDLLEKPRKLSVIGDVSCDPDGSYNPLPIYTQATSFNAPVQSIQTQSNQRLDLVAIDHLPSLLPKESTEDFSSQLLPHLLDLDQDLDRNSEVWKRAQSVFEEKLKELKKVKEESPA
jgi:saccharopine dehydrogenase (NAD+, L-lysine forming)